MAESKQRPHFPKLFFIARIVTWALALCVISLTWGVIGITPNVDLSFSQSLLSLMFWSGVPVLSMAELIIRNHGDDHQRQMVCLAICLPLLPITFFYAGAVAAHTDELAIGYGACALWAGASLLLARVIGGSWPGRHLLVGALALTTMGMAIFWPVVYWLWPSMYHDYLRPNQLLDWTPWAMGGGGILLWGTLLWLSRWAFKISPSPVNNSGARQVCPMQRKPRMERLWGSGSVADYSSVDQVINAWVERHGFSLYTHYAGGPECRNVYVSHNDECCQIWIDPPESGRVALHAADVETRNDEEMRKDWHVPAHNVEQALEEALAFVRQWMKRND